MVTGIQGATWKMAFKTTRACVLYCVQYHSNADHAGVKSDQTDAVREWHDRTTFVKHAKRQLTPIIAENITRELCTQCYMFAATIKRTSAFQLLYTNINCTCCVRGYSSHIKHSKLARNHRCTTAYQIKMKYLHNAYYKILFSILIAKLWRLKWRKTGTE